MWRRVSFFIVHAFLVTALILPSFALAQTQKTISAQTLMQKVQLFFSQRTGTFSEGSTFEVPILLNTQGASVNTVELYVKYDPRKLAIIQPSGDKSIIGIWLQAPSFSNTAGTAKIIGAIPNGIVTNSGIVTTITFKAIESGQATVSIQEGSRVLANDGLGSDLLAQFDRATFSIIPQAPQGVTVFSETHPFVDQWYNNNNPVLAWEADPKMTGFSYIIDNEPFTNPDNTIDATSTIVGYENLPDGLWYFHIKAQKGKLWGATTHYLMRIDTSAPAAFTPTYENMSTAMTRRPTFVSFFTTDGLSGIDHYEVGVIDKSVEGASSPLFVQTTSPFQVPTDIKGDVKVLVRVFDRAGNVQNAAIDIHVNPTIMGYINEHRMEMGMIGMGVLLFFILLHYIFGHHFFRRARRAIHTFNEVEPREVRTYVLAGPHEDSLPASLPQRSYQAQQPAQFQQMPQYQQGSMQQQQYYQPVQNQFVPQQQVMPPQQQPVAQPPQQQ